MNGKAVATASMIVAIVVAGILVLVWAIPAINRDTTGATAHAVLPDIRLATTTSAAQMAIESFVCTDGSVKRAREQCPGVATAAPSPVIAVHPQIMTTMAPPTSPVTLTMTSIPPTAAPQRVQVLGETRCVYKMPCQMPPPAAMGQIMLAVGDIHDDGRCHVRVFGPGQTVAGLGSGSFNVLRLAGPSGLLDREVLSRATLAAPDDPEGVCPRLG